MCLGIPGRIEAITNPEARLALVDVLGVKREVNIACIVDEGEALESCIGAWVLVHVGFAMNRIDEAEAALTLQLLKELGDSQAEFEAYRQGTDGLNTPEAVAALTPGHGASSAQASTGSAA
jgi:hydrogenase expression/formation protein HypC